MRVDGRPVVRSPLVVHTTRAEMRGLIRRMESMDRASLVGLSNEKFRACHSHGDLSDFRRRCSREGGEEEWGRMCGDVLIIYAARWVLDARGVPLVDKA